MTFSQSLAHNSRLLAMVCDDIDMRPIITLDAFITVISFPLLHHLS